MPSWRPHPTLQAWNNEQEIDKDYTVIITGMCDFILSTDRKEEMEIWEGKNKSAREGEGQETGAERLSSSWVQAVQNPQEKSTPYRNHSSQHPFLA